jgi:triacylglycerol lipase
MKISHLWHWVKDYSLALHGHAQAFIFKEPPKHYLGFVKEGKAPIILLPGIFTTWHWLKNIADPLSLKGHPIYVLKHLGYNAREIQQTAELVRGFIEEKDLKNAIIIAHSKGGLIGKYVLAFYNWDKRIKKLIAIASPFGGSRIAQVLPLKSVKEMHPQSDLIAKLQAEKTVNKEIVSIYAIFDNHIWPHTSPILEGAENIQIEVHGHHKIVFDKKVKEIVSAKIENL